MTVGESVVVQTAPADAGTHGHAIAQTIYGNAAGPYINGIVSRVTGPVITIAKVQIRSNGSLRKTGAMMDLVYNHTTNFSGASSAELGSGIRIGADVVGTGTRQLIQAMVVYRKVRSGGQSSGWQQITAPAETNNEE